ncbi:uncharacterized protein PV06_05342 [Exophiala oligosperma]|nr:uncharacterized protein PV06_05342 [Exophiala oligosperma]KIW44326.1 hypothetical protein PV06_05342 [Exophiala oligosperma]
MSFPNAGGGGPSTMTMPAPQVQQDETELGPHVGEITAAVVGASFGVMLLGILALFLCLHKRSKTSNTVRFAASQDMYGQPLVPTFTTNSLEPQYADGGPDSISSIPQSSRGRTR